MRLVGFCEGCRRIRPVKVGGRGMAALAARQTPVGICVSCERKEDEKRRAR